MPGAGWNDLVLALILLGLRSLGLRKTWDSFLSFSQGYCGLICSSGARPCDRIPSTCRRSDPCRSLCLCRSNRPCDRIPSTCHRTLRGRSSLCLCRSSSRPFRGCNRSPCDRTVRVGRTPRGKRPYWARSRRRRRTACGWSSCHRRSRRRPGSNRRLDRLDRLGRLGRLGRRPGTAREGCRAWASPRSDTRSLGRSVPSGQTP